MHLIIYTDPATARSWSDADVIERWRRALPTQQPRPASSVSAAWIAEKRERLALLSWFMKLLNEPIARQANAEDDCTGHFWESRFRSQALLDERAITAAMAYVDLNPIRAGIAQTLEISEYTSIARRLRERLDAQVVRSAAGDQAATASRTSDHASTRLKPIAGLLQHQLHTISTEQYIELVAWSASIAQPGKHHLESPTAALEAIGCEEAQWHEQIDAVRCGWRVVGGSAQMRELAQKIGQHWFKRRSRRPDKDVPQVESG